MAVHMHLQVQSFTAAADTAASQQVVESDKEGESTWRRGDKTMLTDRAEHLHGN